VWYDKEGPREGCSQRKMKNPGGSSPHGIVQMFHRGLALEHGSNGAVPRYTSRTKHSLNPNHSHPLGSSSLISTPSNLTFAGHPSWPVASFASLSKPFTASSISSSSRAISAGSSAASSASVSRCTAVGEVGEVDELEARRRGAESVSGTGRVEVLGPARGREGRRTEGRRR
jgi:hypothetical protein